MPYLVATDLDGTLLRHDFTVSDRTRRALRDAVAADIALVFATGRPPRWLPAVYETTGQHPVTICANGALTLQDGEPVHIDAIPEEVVAQVRQVLVGLHSGFVFRTERWRGHTLKLLATVPDLAEHHADAVLAQVQQAAGHLVEPTHSAHGYLLIEMGPSGVTKAHAVERLREQRWPGRTLIAIGDMPNDLALLQAADIPMTVETGHPSLREVADRVLSGPEDDGVAQMLEELAADGGVRPRHPADSPFSW